jgi:hypothetical protein
MRKSRHHNERPNLLLPQPEEFNACTFSPFLRLPVYTFSAGRNFHEMTVLGDRPDMEAARTSETSISFYHTTRLNISVDSHLHTRRRENVKSHQA